MTNEYFSWFSMDNTKLSTKNGSKALFAAHLCIQEFRKVSSIMNYCKF
jgi:hypothetical protein